MNDCIVAFLKTLTRADAQLMRIFDIKETDAAAKDSSTHPQPDR
jgi:hypothetical protein